VTFRIALDKLMARKRPLPYKLRVREDTRRHTTIGQKEKNN